MSDDAQFLRWFPLIFCGAWIGISLLISWIGGWRDLAAEYRSTRPFAGKAYWMKSAGMRWGVGYRGSINLRADPSGLFLSVFPMFRVGHPPLFIPWGDISFTQKRQWWTEVMELRFRRVPGVPLLLRSNLGLRVFAERPIEIRGPDEMGFVDGIARRCTLVYD